LLSLKTLTASLKGIVTMAIKNLTDEEAAWLDKIEAAIDKMWVELTPFEQKFLEGIIEQYHRYGRATHISARQWEIITEISDKIIT
jgi:hypothetical protein